MARSRLIGAVVVLGVSELGSTVLFAWMPMALRERGWSISQLGAASTVVGALSSIGHAVGYGLLVAAIFSRRAIAG